MPPLRSWYQGREGIAVWAAASPMSGNWRWRTAFVRANGQLALGFYSRNEAEPTYLPFALNVLTLRGAEISDVTAFIARSIESTDPEAYQRFPEEPMDPRRLTGTFERFGLPGRLD
jgi:hypothetical protein